MISASEMQKGLTIDIEGEPYTVLDWRNVTEGREGVYSFLGASFLWEIYFRSCL